MPAYFAVPNLSEQGFQGLGQNQLAWANQVNSVLSEEERARQYWQQAKEQAAQVARQNEALSYNRRAANIQNQDVIRQNQIAQGQRQREIAQQMAADREQMASRERQYFMQQNTRDAAQQQLTEQRAQKANFNQVLRMTEAGIYKTPQDIPSHIEQTLTVEQRGFLSPYFQQQERNTAQSTGDLGLLREVALAARRQKEIDARTFKLKSAKEKINQKESIALEVDQLPEDKLPVLDAAETALAIKTWNTQKALPAEARQRNYFGTETATMIPAPVVAPVAPVATPTLSPATRGRLPFQRPSVVPEKPVASGTVISAKVARANELRKQHPDWSKEAIIAQVNQEIP